MEKFDIAIIGAGPGGYATALRSAKNGLSVALIEKEAIGGVCLNSGCVPAKAWISAAETMDHAKHMSQYAQEPFSYRVDFGKAVAKQQQIVSRFCTSLEGLLIKKGIKIFKGFGAFVSSNVIAVEGDEGQTEIEFSTAVIAIGSLPARFFDCPPELMLDSSSIFKMKKLPGSMLIVGAGAIGCEFAGALARFGVEVTLVELEGRILPMEDKEISATLTREFKKARIKIKTGVSISSLEAMGDGVVARLDGGEEIVADKALLSVGKRFATGALGLDKAGVRTGERGEIVTDVNMRSSAKNIYAVGDVAGKNMLAYTAYKEGEMVADIAARKDAHQGERVVPNAIFTMPEVGSVGVTEENAPGDAKTGKFMFRSLARAHAVGEIAGFVKIIADKASDEILGVHIIGPRATDMIHIAVVAISARLTASKLGELLFAHPTFAEAIGEAAMDVHNRALHQ